MRFEKDDLLQLCSENQRSGDSATPAMRGECVKRLKVVPRSERENVVRGKIIRRIHTEPFRIFGESLRGRQPFGLR